MSSASLACLIVPNPILHPVVRFWDEMVSLSNTFSWILKSVLFNNPLDFIEKVALKRWHDMCYLACSKLTSIPRLLLFRSRGSTEPTKVSESLAISIFRLSSSF